MITCPWCGTNYTTFQSDCPKCGGPMSVPEGNTATDPAGRLLRPPSPPCAIADRYVWHLLMTDSRAIAAFVFLLLGAIFALVGMALTLGIVTAFVGIPFVGLGFLFLVAGAVVAGRRYQEAQKIVGVLRTGEAVEGQITQVVENLHVRVGENHPWVISYKFQVDGQLCVGQVNTLNTPGIALQPGQRAWVLVLPNEPGCNVLYPHP